MVYAYVNRVLGTARSETVYGTYYNDDIFGFAGNDVLLGYSGHDDLYGGEGNDRLLGGSGDDYLSGGSGRDRLLGGTGNDYLYGDDGNDVLFGESGVNVLAGGRGNDTYLYQSTLISNDILIDGQGSSDILNLAAYSEYSLFSGYTGEVKASDYNLNGKIDSLLIWNPSNNATVVIRNYFADSTFTVEGSRPGTGCLEALVLRDATLFFEDVVEALSPAGNPPGWGWDDGGWGGGWGDFPFG